MSNHIKYLYLHIPFCKTKCPYCDFYSISTADIDTKKLYTSALIKEFNMLSNKLTTPLNSVYLGGGSPLMIGRDNLRLILSNINTKCSKDTEITIELNPEHLEENDDLQDSISLFKEFNINRVSIGVQTTEPRLKDIILRRFNIEKLSKLISLLLTEKTNISLDFMFGLPGQTIMDLERDISFIKNVQPDHVSMYLFTPPTGYALSNLIPEEKVIEKMFSIIHSKLKAFDFEHYEISNYAKANKYSRHNMAYWKREPYLGLGAGAHSFYENTRSWHLQDVSAYIKDPSCKEQEKINKEMEYTETIMLGLRMLTKGIPLSFFKNEKYKALVLNGMLLINDSNVTIAPKYIPLLDTIIKELV